MKVLFRLCSSLRRSSRNEEGGATVEFAIIFPVLITAVLAVFESGWLMTRYMMLDRGVDMAVRDLRLGEANTATHAAMKTSICDYTVVLKDCDTTLVLQVEEYDADKAYPDDQANCYDRITDATKTVISYDPGDRGKIMFIRACVIVDPFFPGMGIGLRMPKDESGGHQMVSFSAFMNEPS